MEKILQSCVEKHRQLIADAFTYLWKNPETGYKEWKSHKYLADAFEALGYKLTLAGNIPGFTAEVDTGRPGPTVAVFGELDGLYCPTHPEADPETGAVHACGHCGQGAALLGLAAGLKEPGALDGMSGKILLVVVPAEELIEIGYREGLRKQGIIKYFGGKPEFLYRGLLDGVDMCFMIHNGAGEHGVGTVGGRGTNGCMTKEVVFHGKSAHAGGAPHRGINALYAANHAMVAINALRETFQDNDHIRVHPILTAAGESVNAIPDRVVLECYVRAADVASMQAANNKINRAIAASAAAMGAKATISDKHGYCPRIYDREMLEVTREAMDIALEETVFNENGWGTGCSDLGDMSMLMPAVHPGIRGATGTGHGSDFVFPDGGLDALYSAKTQMMMLWLLLRDDAARAKKILAEFKPTFASKEAYFEFADAMTACWDAVSYREDGNVVLLLQADTVNQKT